MSKKTWYKRAVAQALILAMLPVSTYAISSSEYKQKIKEEQNYLNNLQSQQKETSNQIDNKNGQVDKIVNQQDDVIGQLKALDEKIDITDAKISALNEEIGEIRGKIEVTKKKIYALKAKIKAKQKEFEDRLVVMYKNGQVGTLEILLASDDINDFLNRQTMIEKVAKFDKDLIAELMKDKEDLDALELKYNGQKATLEASKSTVEEQKKILKNDQKLKGELLSNLQLEETATREEIEELKNQSEEYYAKIEEKKREISSLRDKQAQQEAKEERAIRAEQARKREAERKKRLAEQARAKRENSKKESNKNNSNDYNYTKKSKETANTRISSSGLQWPTDSYYITCYYGFRRNPFGGYSGEFHGGLDIGAASGTNVYAAQSGTIVWAGYMGTYGNLIKLKHDDGTYSTYYAHLSGYAVTYGQHVNRGQVIGYVGTTGRSTGPHLHFEVRYNGVRRNPLNYL